MNGSVPASWLTVKIYNVITISKRKLRKMQCLEIIFIRVTYARRHGGRVNARSKSCIVGRRVGAQSSRLWPARSGGSSVAQPPSLDFGRAGVPRPSSPAVKKTSQPAGRSAAPAVARRALPDRARAREPGGLRFIYARRATSELRGLRRDYLWCFYRPTRASATGRPARARGWGGRARRWHETHASCPATRRRGGGGFSVRRRRAASIRAARRGSGGVSRAAARFTARDFMNRPARGVAALGSAEESESRAATCRGDALRGCRRQLRCHAAGTCVRRLSQIRRRARGRPSARATRKSSVAAGVRRTAGARAAGTRSSTTGSSTSTHVVYTRTNRALKLCAMAAARVRVLRATARGHRGARRRMLGEFIDSMRAFG